MPNNRIVVFFVGTLPILMQAKFHPSLGFGTRSCGKDQIRCGVSLRFLRRGIVAKLVGFRHGGQDSRFDRSIYPQSENGVIQRVQFFEQGLLLIRHRLLCSLILFGLCKNRRCRKEQHRREAEQVFHIQVFHSLVPPTKIPH